MGASVRPDADPYAHLYGGAGAGTDPYAHLYGTAGSSDPYAHLYGGAKPPALAPRDVTQTPATSDHPAAVPKESVLDKLAEDIGPSLRPEPPALQQMATQAVQHPLKTVAGMAVAPLESGFTLGKYAGQKALAIEGRPPLLDPVSGRDAALAAAQVGTLALAGPAEEAIGAGATPLLGARGAGALASAVPAAAIGAAYNPEHPVAGAVVGGALGATRLLTRGERSAPAPVAPEAAVSTPALPVDPYAHLMPAEPAEAPVRPAEASAPAKAPSVEPSPAAPPVATETPASGPVNPLLNEYQQSELGQRDRVNAATEDAARRAQFPMTVTNLLDHAEAKGTSIAQSAETLRRAGYSIPPELERDAVKQQMRAQPSAEPAYGPPEKTDLFGNAVGPTVEQGSLLSEGAGTAQSRIDQQQLARKDQAISPEEMAQRRDVLGAPKPDIGGKLNSLRQRLATGEKATMTREDADAMFGMSGEPHEAAEPLTPEQLTRSYADNVANDVRPSQRQGAKLEYAKNVARTLVIRGFDPAAIANHVEGKNGGLAYFQRGEFASRDDGKLLDILRQVQDRYEAGGGDVNAFRAAIREVLPKQDPLSEVHEALGTLQHKPKEETPSEQPKKAARRKPVAGAVNPKYKLLDTDALLDRAAELEGRLEEYSSGVHGGPEYVSALDRNEVYDPKAMPSAIEQPHVAGTSVRHRLNQDAQLYRSVVDELKARGVDEDTIDEGMAKRGRVLTTADDFSFDDVEHRHAGFGLTPAQLRAFRHGLSEAVTDPNARIADQHPAIDQALASANAMTPEHASTFARQAGARVLKGLTSDQQQQFGTRLIIDQLDAEATRKAQSDPKAAQRLTSEATKLRGQIPPNVEAQPWFQSALAKHKALVQPFTEAAASEAGVDPASFRKPSLGAYVRLVSQDRLNERAITRTQDVAATEGSEAVTPRTGAARVLLGQKPRVVELTPPGAKGPLHGPANLAREGAPPQSVTPPSATKESGSAKRVTGTARGYSTDYLTNIAFDAGDKVAKASQNSIYRAVAGAGFPELPPEQNAPPGQRVVAFDDKKQLVQVPANAPVPPNVRRFAVPPDVANAITRYQRQPAPASGVAKALKGTAGAITRSVLLNPAVAATHAMTLASSVGEGIPASGAVDAAISTVPVVRTAVSLERMGKVDFTKPATVERLNRLAREGALRVSDTRAGGLLNKGHDFLFGPQGMDARARVIASEDFEKAAVAQGLAKTDPRFAVAERKYVTEHAGNYVGKNQGVAAQWLQDSGIAPFIAINRAKWGTSLKALVGSDGTPNPSIGRRLAVAARGPLGTAGAIAAASYAISGHGPDQNAPGHETDVALGVYHLPKGGGLVYRPGDPDAVLPTLPKGAKELYIRGAIVDPATAGVRRIGGAVAGGRPGSKLADGARQTVNEVLSLIGPAPAAAFTLATGKAPHLGSDNTFASAENPHLGKDAGLKDRGLAVLRSANAAGAMAAGPVGDQPRQLLGGRVVAEASPAGRQGALRRDEGSWQDAITKRIYAEPDAAKKQAIMEDALTEAASQGFKTTWLRAQFTKAINRSAAGSSRAPTKFRNRLLEPR